VTIVTWFAFMSMWRRINGRMPWPMLPKPTITSRPRNFAYLVVRAIALPL
jgi:hypothetical protein